MALSVRRARYFYTTVDNTPGKGAEILGKLRSSGISLLAFTVFPVDAQYVQMDFLSDHPDKLKIALEEEGFDVVGPRKAFLIQGEDTVGALVEHHVHLAAAGISVYAANGVADGRGHFGYVLWVAPDDFERAAEILGC
jgi:hypothetical protein